MAAIGGKEDVTFWKGSAAFWKEEVVVTPSWETREPPNPAGRPNPETVASGRKIRRNRLARCGCGYAATASAAAAAGRNRRHHRGGREEAKMARAVCEVAMAKTRRR